MASAEMRWQHIISGITLNIRRKSKLYVFVVMRNMIQCNYIQMEVEIAEDGY